MQVNVFGEGSVSSVCVRHILFVPVIDLVDVAKHDLVFPFHIIRDTLLFYPAHVALMMETHMLILMNSRESAKYQQINYKTVCDILKC